MTKKHLIYSDGNYFPRAKKSGFGGYIQDPNGDILVEYTEQIKQPQYVYNFEILGIIRGLQLAQSMGLKNIISYCDDKTTIARIHEILYEKNGDPSYLPENAKPELFIEMMKLANTFDSFKFEYIPRNLNKHSDALSRRYSALMEQNFMRQYEEDLLKSENVLETQDKPKGRIFFSHPNMVKMKDKNNPFLVAPLRNKKSRKISRVEQDINYQYLFIEEIRLSEDEYSLSAFHYNEKMEKDLLSQTKIIPSDEVEEFCSFLINNMKKIAKKSKQPIPIWVYSNNSDLNKIFEQKEKIKKDALPFFSKLYNDFDNVPRIMFHNLPFQHDFNPIIAAKEKKKSEIEEDLETIDYLIEQLQNGLIKRTQNKYFGKLIRFQLRNYRKLLNRDLNEIEKQDIINQTTTELESKGLFDLPRLKMA